MKKYPWLSLGLLALVSALAYLPLATQMGYTNDDWYLMYSAKAYGPQVFHQIFSIDRPLRAFHMQPLYLLFGGNPLGYHLLAWFFRLMGAVAFWRLLLALWPRARQAAVWTALLFVIYPGFLSQPNAIDYQSHITALCLAMLSLLLGVSAQQQTRWLPALGLWAGAVLSGVAYLGLMEYYIGFELVRVGLVFLLACRERAGWLARLQRTALAWLPLGLAPGLFLFWRLVLFKGERQATDAGSQLGLLLASPLRTLAGWFTGLLQDALDVLVLAWGVPVYRFGLGLGPADFAAALLLSAVALAAVFFWQRAEATDPQETVAESAPDRADWRWLGLFWLFAGLIPVMLANRQVTLPEYSRYTLVACAGGLLLLVAGLNNLGQRSRSLVLMALVASAIWTHYGSALEIANATREIRAFWWQVAWRAPQLAKNTTILASYPSVGVPEDYFVWGPANLIYYPEKQEEKYIQPGVFGVVPNQQNLLKILRRERQEYDKRRTIRTYANYRNLLVITQPSAASCVHLLDGRQPEFSSAESTMVLSVGRFSDLEQVQADEAPHTPPSLVFGPEPDHGWCYYYQQADLARQLGNWPEVSRLGDEARQRNLAPADLVEWIPFLQAAAHLGQSATLAELAPVLQADSQALFQACQALNGLPGSELFCSTTP